MIGSCPASVSADAICRANRTSSSTTRTRMSFKSGRILEPYCELGCDQVIVVLFTCGFVLKAILEFQLSMRRETIAERRVDPAQILGPANMTSRAIGYVAEELLVPTKRAKELRCEFIFRLNIVSECVRVAYSRNLKAGFVKFRP